MIELLTSGRILDSFEHSIGGSTTRYVIAPTRGNFKVRVTNDSPFRRLFIPSVDAVNVLNGEDADPDGPGYVLGPWESVDILGWRRDAGRVARFKFTSEESGYAAKTGRGTRNVGAIGVAIFDEKPKPSVIPPIVIHEHHYPDWRPYPHWWTDRMRKTFGDTDNTFPLGAQYSCSIAGSHDQSQSDLISHALAAPGGSEGTKSRKTILRSANASVTRQQTVAKVKSVSTGYGAEASFQTRTTDFVRATEAPAAIVEVRYATRSQLKAWGVPIPKQTQPVQQRTPSAFPGHMQVPAPDGWRG